jgi:glycosyltransferase involved in cell wall biosynthesis
MKVLMVTPFYYPTTIGGTESLIENISRELNKHGITTDIMTSNYITPLKTVWKEKIEVINGLNVVRVPAAILPRPTFFINHFVANFRSKMRQYNIVHFHNDTDLSFPLFSYGLGMPKLFHCHCIDTTYDDYIRNPIARQIFLRSADIFIALSRFLSEKLSDLGVPIEKIRIVPNGVDVNRFREGMGNKIENLLLFVGRLDPKKGIPVLLQSLKHLNKPVRLVMIGPLSAYGEYSKNIVKLIDDVRKKTIHTITYLGPVEPQELVRWYQKASILVLPSIAESFPMVNIESLACGTPVVASNVGAVSEVVRDHENGILVPPRDPFKLAEALQYLLDNEDTRLKFGKQGVKWIHENFSSEAVITRLIEIYRTLQ